MIFLPIGDQPNPRGTPIVNYALLAVNVAVFLVVTLPLMGRAADPTDPATQEYLRALLRGHPGADPELLVMQALRQLSAYDVFLMTWGYRPADPSPLALLSSMFLHGGWLHLLGNMLFLWIYGDNVEHRLGRLGYLAAYLGTGALAAVGYGLLAPAGTGNAPMVGASGAISGVLGFYFLWFPRNQVRVFVWLFIYVDVWLVNARIVLGFFILADNLLPYLLSSRGAGGGVAYGAHIGGFVAGLLGAFLVNRWMDFRCRRSARACGEEPEPRSGTPDSDGVVRAFEEGDLQEAARRYLTLPTGDRRRVPLPVVAALGDWLASGQQADAALALYGQALAARPREPGAARLALGIGLVLLYQKQRPTAAYQYLMDVLDADPEPVVEQRAREALAHIETLQKHKLNRWRRR
jgi:membrane associated rhomboid family serine protease